MHHKGKEPTDKSTVQAINGIRQLYSGSNLRIVYGKVFRNTGMNSTESYLNEIIEHTSREFREGS
jgi:hypothetical protein